jgi:hypothetical protein
MDLDLARERFQIGLGLVLAVDAEIKGAEMTPSPAEWNMNVKTNAHSYKVRNSKCEVRCSFFEVTRTQNFELRTLFFRGAVA